ncbi:hypothetical protein L596_008522 [Steinernema carpocapsae]|uniref:Uncharacterized protein n=1 Tax=Steinernema carpocapsae TaxID=34508 RepID=A0A4U5PCR8_STECR|nr:hypothetical protein L596_008522 [Steinernema carpocapsae]
MEDSMLQETVSGHAIESLAYDLRASASSKSSISTFCAKLHVVLIHNLCYVVKEIFKHEQKTPLNMTIAERHAFRKEAFEKACLEPSIPSTIPKRTTATTQATSSRATPTTPKPSTSSTRLTASTTPSTSKPNQPLPPLLRQTLTTTRPTTTPTTSTRLTTSTLDPFVSQRDSFQSKISFPKLRILVLNNVGTLYRAYSNSKHVYHHDCSCLNWYIRNGG